MNFDFTTYAIFITGFFLVIFVFGLVWWVRFKRRRNIDRSLDLDLLLITVPRHSIRSGDEPEDDLSEEEKGAPALMESIYRSLLVLSGGVFTRLKFGAPYVALEMSVHHVGEEINFYVAVPKGFVSAFEKRVHGSYPAAQIERVKDYNIFTPGGHSAGSYLKLSKDPVLPINTYRDLKIDTLDQLTTALSKIAHRDEGAAIQILVRPAGSDKFRKRAGRVIAALRDGKSLSAALSNARGKESKTRVLTDTFSSDSKGDEDISPAKQVVEEDVIGAISHKANQPAFECNIRLMTSASDAARAKELLSEIEGAFTQFNSPSGNSLKSTKVKGGKLKNLSFAFSFRLFEEGQVVYLSSEELASIYHLPLGGVAAPRIKYLHSRPVEPPSVLPREGVVLGNNIFRGVETTVRMSEDDRRRHLYMIGQTGTGKSSLMKNMIAQDIKEGKGICVIDPHGDLAEYALSQVPKERASEVIYFNPGETERVLGLNMLEFDPNNPEQKTFIVNELLKIFDKLYDLRQTGGPLFEQYFRNALLLVMDDAENEPPTFASVSRVLSDSAYRADKLSREKNPLVREFWTEQAEKAGGEAALANMVPYITSKFDQFLANDFMRPIINQRKSSFNFREVMDEGKILVVNLSKGRIGDLNANLLGMIIVGRLLMAALSRVDSSEGDRKDFYLYVDEFQNFTTDSIATILSEARKYRLGLVVAHQFIKQLPDNIRDAVFGNVGSTVAFRVGAEDAEVLEKQFEPVISANDLSNLDNFNAYVKLLINNQTSRPFNINTIRPQEPDLGWVEKVKEKSLSTYARPRNIVEEEIRNSYGKTPPSQEL